MNCNSLTINVTINTGSQIGEYIMLVDIYKVDIHLSSP